MFQTEQFLLINIMLFTRVDYIPKWALLLVLMNTVTAKQEGLG